MAKMDIKKKYQKREKQKRNTITQAQWDLFLRMADACEKKQDKACDGCHDREDCRMLGEAIGELCTSYKVGNDYSRAEPSIGNPCVSGHEDDLRGIIKLSKPSIHNVRWIPRAYSTPKVRI